MLEGLTVYLVAAAKLAAFLGACEELPFPMNNFTTGCQ